MTDDEWREEVLDRLERGECDPHADINPPLPGWEQIQDAYEARRDA